MSRFINLSFLLCLLILSVSAFGHFPDDDSHDWRIIFHSFDFDSNGLLNKFEFQQFLLNIYSTDSSSRIYKREFEKLAELLDFDGDSQISSEEFRKIYSRFWNVIANPRICYRLVISDEIIQKSSSGELFPLSREFAINSINRTRRELSFGSLVKAYVGPCRSEDEFTFEEDILLILSDRFQNIELFPSTEPNDQSCNIIVHSQFCSQMSSDTFQANILMINDPNIPPRPFNDYSSIEYNEAASQKDFETDRVILKLALFYARQLHRKYYNNILLSMPFY